MIRMNADNTIGIPAGSYTDMSELFLYFATRLLQRDVANDTGAENRTVMKAMALFGGVPEDMWPYDVSRFAMAPTLLDNNGRPLPGGDAAIWAMATKFSTLRYIRLDPISASANDVLYDIKAVLFSRMLVMFGTLVYGQIFTVGTNGDIAMPKPGEFEAGGHAMEIIGYDDDHPNLDGSKGAFEVRNSWDSGWGDKGYGWLPYGYLFNGLLKDAWTVQDAEWVDTEVFV